MKWYFQLILASLTSFFLGLSIQISAQDYRNNNAGKPNIDLDPNLEFEQVETKIKLSKKDHDCLTETKIKSLAESITVKVLSGKNSGSGFILDKERDVYTVVTNEHVLIFGKEDSSYKIITPDGKKYLAKPVNNIDFKNQDLGLLIFHSVENYPVINLNLSAEALVGEEVYAAGFPFSSDKSIPDEFIFSKGNIEMISDLSFRGGYQIGYTNTIKKGMSGGPIFNHKGEIIGINGRHKYPLWGNPYIFEDGTIASPEKKEEMSKLSWGIPIQTLLEFSIEIKQSLHSISKKH